MSRLDVGDPARLEAALLAVPEGTWVVVSDGVNVFKLVRVPGGQLHLPGDMAISCGDVAYARPESVTVVDTDLETVQLVWDLDAAEAEVLRALGGDERWTP